MRKEKGKGERKKEIEEEKGGRAYYRVNILSFLLYSRSLVEVNTY